MQTDQRDNKLKSKRYDLQNDKQQKIKQI